ncbi:MAG: Sir2 silent information regulator family NAD-dependent deacetylase [Lachnospiraceae bacterium]|nr:Sir2 silent information regulator family NAD-dependent deacetylase [Lachnospiraceae bacterium]
MQFGKIVRGGVENYIRKVRILKEVIQEADAILIGCGAGLSAAAGLSSPVDFEENFADFIEKYHMEDAYRGLYSPFASSSEMWAYIARVAWFYRYNTHDNGLYDDMLEVLKDKNYFFVTTNIDAQLKKAGFEEERIFPLEGDYGEFQCIEPCHQEVYENEKEIRKLMLSQGFTEDEYGNMISNENVNRAVKKESIPVCPKCGRNMALHVNFGAHFARPDEWYISSAAKDDFLLKNRDKKILYLELGSGPYKKEFIRHPLWELTMRNPNATYVCVNLGECSCPEAIEDRSILLDADIKTVFNDLVKLNK